MLRGLVSLFLLVGLLVGWKILQPAEPCTKPISYVLGTFDTRFGVSRENFLQALRDAETIWESSIGRELFAYNAERGKLAVHLIYDYRQEATQELNLIEGEVQEGNSEYQALEAEYRALKSGYTRVKASYDAEVALFNQHNAEYEKHVEAWNSGPRTSKKQFDELESEREALESEAESLKTTERELNNLVREINEKVSELNTLAKELNLNVREYNAIGQARGETFAGGTYTSDRTGERIDIFEFENQAKLVRVLAHELGHALGLEHVEDPQAIMYHLNEGQRSSLAPSDLLALKTLCAINE